MTIAQAIKEIIKGYDQNLEPGLNYLPSADSIGIFSAPHREVTECIDDTLLITESYNIFFQLPDTTATLREGNDSWLDGFCDYIDFYHATHSFPIVSPRKKIVDIKLTAAPCVLDATAKKATIQTIISVSYVKSLIDL